MDECWIVLSERAIEVLECVVQSSSGSAEDRALERRLLRCARREGLRHDDVGQVLDQRRVTTARVNATHLGGGVLQLRQRLIARAKHDRASPTCWIWEGVVMYLSRDAMRATLAGIAKRSAPGSTLIVNYHTLHRRFLARLIFRLIGEPQISAWTSAQMADDLRNVGFVVREDSGMLDWNTRFTQGKANVGRGAYMRIAIAQR